MTFNILAISGPGHTKIKGGTTITLAQAARNSIIRNGIFLPLLNIPERLRSHLSTCGVKDVLVEKKMFLSVESLIKTQGSFCLPRKKRLSPKEKLAGLLAPIFEESEFKLIFFQDRGELFIIPKNHETNER